jgi:hypothetical protein
LICNGWKYELWIATFRVITRAKEARPQDTMTSAVFSNSKSDGCFPCSARSVDTKDAAVIHRNTGSSIRILHRYAIGIWSEAFDVYPVGNLGKDTGSSES